MAQLRRIHSNEVYEKGLGRLSLNYWRTKASTEIIQSLQPGLYDSLKVKSDGRIMDGNTRIKVLEERGYDVNVLPFETIE